MVLLVLVPPENCSSRHKRIVLIFSTKSLDFSSQVRKFCPKLQIPEFELWQQKFGSITFISFYRLTWKSPKMAAAAAVAAAAAAAARK